MVYRVDTISLYVHAGSTADRAQNRKGVLCKPAYARKKFGLTGL